MQRGSKVVGCVRGVTVTWLCIYFSFDMESLWLTGESLLCLVWRNDITMINKRLVLSILTVEATGCIHAVTRVYKYTPGAVTQCVGWLKGVTTPVSLLANDCESLYLQLLDFPLSVCLSPRLSLFIRFMCAAWWLRGNASREIKTRPRLMLPAEPTIEFLRLFSVVVMSFLHYFYFIFLRTRRGHYCPRSFHGTFRRCVRTPCFYLIASKHFNRGNNATV